MALNHEREWPPRSPDLTPCDLFLCGYIKLKVFQTPENIFQLRERISSEFDLLKQNPQMIIRSVTALQTRATICLEHNGEHVERR